MQSVRLVLFLLLLFTLHSSLFTCYAADPTPVPPPVRDIGDPPPPPLPPDTSGLPDWMGNLIAKAPWLATIIFAIGALRLVIKPVMLAVEWYTKQTNNPNDDVAVLKFQAGPFYKTLSIALDWIGSIKLPAVLPPPPKPPTS